MNCQVEKSRAEQILREQGGVVISKQGTNLFNEWTTPHVDATIERVAVGKFGNKPVESYRYNAPTLCDGKDLLFLTRDQGKHFSITFDRGDDFSGNVVFNRYGDVLIVNEKSAKSKNVFHHPVMDEESFYKIPEQLRMAIKNFLVRYNFEMEIKEY